MTQDWWRLGFLLVAGHAWVGAALATPSFRDSLGVEGGSPYPVFYAKREGTRDFPWSPVLRDIAFSDGLHCSAGGTPAARYTLRGGVIWLVGFSRCGGDLSLDAAYGKPTEPLPATWISGRLHIGQGQRRCDDPYGTSIWQQRLELIVLQGRVVHEHLRREQERPAGGQSQSDDPCAAWRRPGDVRF